MCGRYSLFTPEAELIDRFGATPETPLSARYNCAPGQSLPVITNEDPETMQCLTWGLTPSWAEESFNLINARAESIREKRSFSDAYASRRCLVLADGFYEWVDRDGSKQPYRVAFEDDRPFAMAGIYERWQPPTTQTGLSDFTEGDAESDDVVESFAIVTTEPNDLIADLHHRMAVILDPREEAEWLQADPDAAESLLDPYPDDELRAYPVSTRVNSPGNDDPSLIDPV